MVAESGDYSSSSSSGLLIAVAFLVERGLSSYWHTGLVALRHVAIVPDQKSNLCPLNWQADS